VVQGLGKDREVDGFVGQRHLLDVTELVGEVHEAVLFREFGADLDHLGRVVDAPDALGALGEELRDEAFAGTEVGHGDRRHEAQREVAEGFPRAAGAVILPELAGNEVEILFRMLAALVERALEAFAVLTGFG